MVAILQHVLAEAQAKKFVATYVDHTEGRHALSDDCISHYAKCLREQQQQVTHRESAEVQVDLKSSQASACMAFAEMQCKSWSSQGWHNLQMFMCASSRAVNSCIVTLLHMLLPSYSSADASFR